jgi:hypothetical protein
MKIEADTPELLQAAHWYAKALHINRLKCKLVVQYFDEAEDFQGTGWIEYGKGFAEIYIGRELPEGEDEMTVLAHEMVHLKQYLKGEMVDGPFNVVFWHGIAYDSTMDPTSWAYWNSPWELEAFGRQQGLNYMRQINANL